MITLQFLEPGPHIDNLSSNAVRNKLRAAFEILPIDVLIIGWKMPNKLADICREEVDCFDTKLYRWHPLLCTDGNFKTRSEWQTRNLRRVLVPGFRGLPEFTFLCPNNPPIKEAVQRNLRTISQSGHFDGIFLDRMRFPSPSENPIWSLACFCENCQHAAIENNLDLSLVREFLQTLSRQDMINALINSNSGFELLDAFLDFRHNTITKFIKESVDIIRCAGLEVGLDCFSPSLTRMVGQDLAQLTDMLLGRQPCLMN
jgi:hypothetical protein